MRSEIQGAALAAIGPGRSERDVPRFWATPETLGDENLVPENPPAPTPPAAERAKPAASDLWRVLDLLGYPYDPRGKREPEFDPDKVNEGLALFAAARREAAADMRERAALECDELYTCRDMVRSPNDEQRRADMRSAFRIAAQEIRALPLTEEETIPKAEGTSNG